jgi:hypothetical protein
MLYSSTFPGHLKPQNWGFWHNQGVLIKKGALFDHEHRLYIVTGIFDDCVEAKPMFRARTHCLILQQEPTPCGNI